MLYRTRALLLGLVAFGCAWALAGYLTDVERTRHATEQPAAPGESRRPDMVSHLLRPSVDHSSWHESFEDTIYCPPLRKMLDNGTDSFASLKGKALSTTVWESKVSLPGASCHVTSGALAPTHVECSFGAAPTCDELKGKFHELAGQWQRCLKDGWRHNIETFASMDFASSRHPEGYYAYTELGEWAPRYRRFDEMSGTTQSSCPLVVTLWGPRWDVARQKPSSGERPRAPTIFVTDAPDIDPG